MHASCTACAPVGVAEPQLLAPTPERHVRPRPVLPWLAPADPQRQEVGTAPRERFAGTFDDELRHAIGVDRQRRRRRREWVGAEAIAGEDPVRAGEHHPRRHRWRWAASSTLSERSMLLAMIDSHGATGLGSAARWSTTSTPSNHRSHDVIGHGEVGEDDCDAEVDPRRMVGDPDHLDVIEGAQCGHRLHAEVAGDTGDEHTSGQRSVPSGGRQY